MHDWKQRLRRASTICVLHQCFKDIDAKVDADGNGVSFVGIEVRTCQDFHRLVRNLQNAFGGEAVQKLPIEELRGKVFFLLAVSRSATGYRRRDLPRSNAET